MKNKKTILLITIILAIILMVGGAAVFGKKGATGSNWYTVGKTNVIEDVRISAEVKPAQNVDLAFARSGIIGSVNVAVGDTVEKGTTLATLASSDIAAQVAGAQANLDVENAKLAALKKGARPEDIAVAQASLNAANTAADEASGILLDKSRDAYTTADDALHNLATPMFQNPDTQNPKLTFQTSDAKMQIALESERVLVGQTLLNWSMLRTSSTSSDPLTYTSTVESSLREEINFYDMLASALSVALPDSNNTSTVLAGYRASVTLGRTNLNAALSSVIAAKQASENAKAAADVAGRQLSLKQAGATDEDMSAEVARVASAQAALESAQAELAKTTMTAPFRGVITRVDAKRGASTPASVPLVSMISASAFQIEGYVSEVDVANVKKDAKTEVTLDAFGPSQIFPAHVISVDPAPTIISGVGAYKTIIALDQGKDPGIKEGMHANVRIISDEKDGVLAIPKEALISRIGKEYVEVASGAGGNTLTPIVTGLRGNMIEVVSGLTEGEQINSFGDISNTNQ